MSCPDTLQLKPFYKYSERIIFTSGIKTIEKGYFDCYKLLWPPFLSDNIHICEKNSEFYRDIENLFKTESSNVDNAK